ncbi:CoA ester lyase [Rhodococcus sp. IEGM 248]|nr:CoA ester lyase [Rhodococcus sp. IEGM 248]
MSAHRGRHNYRAIKSILETPIMDDHKWGKLPNIPADMIFLDLEDSVAPNLKEQARERVVRSLAEKEFDGEKLLLPRVNHLSTRWGREDAEALAAAKPDVVAYPKVRSAACVDEVLEAFRAHGADPDIFAIIETAESVLNVREIASHPSVIGLMSGPADISLDAGIELYEPGGALNRIFLVTKALTVLAGAAYGLAVTDIAYAKNIRDFDEIRRRVEDSRRMGFTTMTTFYPPHVDIINDVFSPGEEELAKASAVVDTYEKALAEGKAAALTDSGTPVLVHEYEKALALLGR